MSGGSGGIDFKAFNPFSHFGDKSAWDKFGALTGLPVGNTPGSPKWIKAHPKEAVLAAAVAATVLTMGAAAPAIGAAGGGAAAATEGGLLGAAELGAGGAAAAGSGLAAADYGALGMGIGAGATDASLGAAGVANAAAFAPYGGELASVGESGGMGLLGGAPAHATAPLTSNPFSYLQSGMAQTMGPDNYQMLSNGLSKGNDAFSAYNKARQVANLASPQPTQAAPMMPRKPPPMYQQTSDPYLALLEEIKRRQGAGYGPDS